MLVVLLWAGFVVVGAGVGVGVAKVVVMVVSVVLVMVVEPVRVQVGRFAVAVEAIALRTFAVLPHSGFAQ